MQYLNRQSTGTRCNTPRAPRLPAIVRADIAPAFDPFPAPDERWPPASGAAPPSADAQRSGAIRPASNTTQAASTRLLSALIIALPLARNDCQAAESNVFALLAN